MATLQSPGLSITITDESQYVSTGVGSVPLVLLATAENKTNPATGGVASGTTKAKAGVLQQFNSQRELINALGYPQFQSSSGTQLHGDERNEYGLLAAYSALGIGSSVYAIRADIDLNQLTSTATRPIGTVSDGFMWLDLSSTSYGLFSWNSTTQSYSPVTPIVITDSSQVGTDQLNTPNTSVGSVGSYAVVALNANNPMFYRVNTNANYTLFPSDWSNAWVPLGTADWQKAWPTVQSGFATYAGHEVADGTSLTINGVSITLHATDNVTCTANDVVNSINAAFLASYGDGIKADIIGAASGNAANGRLVIRATSAAHSGGVGAPADGKVVIASGVGATALGFTAGTYFAPMLSFGGYTQVPTFGSGDSTPAPTGSLWIKTTSVGGGANWAVKQYNASKTKFVSLTSPLYVSNEEALFQLDPLNGGLGIGMDSIYVDYSTLSNYPATFQVKQRMSAGTTKVTASAAPSTSFTIGNTFTITVTEPGTDALTSYALTVTSTTTAGFIALILSANIPNVYAQVETTGAISLLHRAGGDIILTNTTVGGNPVAVAGFSSSTPGVVLETAGTFAGSLRISNWGSISSMLTFSASTPYVAPTDGTLWYYGNAYEADILIAGADGWKGYRNVSSDARGYDLTQTDPNGPIFSPSAPKLQSTGYPVVNGELWVDTSDLENFPKISRYNATSMAWTLIDKTDHISQNGIVFADARWDASVNNGNSIGGIVDPVAGAIPTISAMLLSNYVDLDCPDFRKYPRGTILWNTRRNGFNVKQYVGSAFTASAYPNAVVSGTHQTGTIPQFAGTWMTASGTASDGTPYMGHYAQRQMVVKALKAAIDSSTQVREEQFQFNLLVAPGYPELISDLNTLNDDRNQTAFIIGDTPMNLSTSATDIVNWSTNVETTGSKMVGVYYPSGLATNPINGSTVAVPPSHMALRTFIHSDNLSYQWFAPAGSRRGIVDNATAIGFVDYASGAFVQTGVTQGLRDTLYNNRINPITNLPGQGLTVFGNRTRDAIDESSNRVNVARLVNYIRTILSKIGNGFLFEPNDKSTRDQVKASIEGALNDLVAKRGIYDYLVVCDTSNNTPDRIAANQLYVDIAIEPMKDVEFIYIPVRLLNPGTVATLGK